MKMKSEKTERRKGGDAILVPSHDSVPLRGVRFS